MHPHRNSNSVETELTFLSLCEKRSVRISKMIRENNTKEIRKVENTPAK